MTPDQVHFGQADAVYATKQNTFDRAFLENSARFVNRTPNPPAKLTASAINPPKPKTTTEA